MDKLFKGLGFSTSWNWRNTNNGRELIEEIMNLGFDTVELNYRITEEMLNTIIPMVNEGIVKISSVHNVFPAINDFCYDTDSLLLSYPNENKRKKSIDLTKRSIDYGIMLGAKAVVIHPGVVPLSPKLNYDKRLKDMYDAGMRNSEEYKKLFDEMICYRNTRSKRYMNLIEKSLEEICEYVEHKNYNIAICIENRAICTQLPDFNEASYLLDVLKDYPVYFWYDIGHGMIMEALGMFNNLEGAQKIKHKIKGMHIHDAIGVDDHWTPYIKSNNIDAFIDIIKDIPIKVIELGAKNKAEDIKKGISILYEKLFGISSSNVSSNLDT